MTARKTQYYAVVIHKKWVEFIHGDLETMDELDMSLHEDYDSITVGDINGPVYCVVYYKPKKEKE